MELLDGITYELVNNTTEWKWDAACQGMGPDIFYLELGQTIENKMRLAQARQICAKCTVRIDCLNYAMDNQIGTGIWAGTTPMQRKKLRHERAS